MANETKFLTGLDLASQQIINVADPTSDQHAATRAYVLAQIAGVNGMTPEEVQDIVGTMVLAGNNIDVTYDDGAGTFTIDVESLTSADITDLTETIQDVAATALTAGNNIDITYDDVAGTITIDVEALTSADLSDFQTAARAAISVTDTATLDLSYSAGAISGAVLDSPLLEGSNKAYYRARGNHTGTQDAATTLTQATARLLGRVTASAGATEELTADQVATFLALVAADISDFSTAADARISSQVTAAFINALSGVDADTLEGSSKAQIITDAMNGVIASAPETLDTLNELAAALGDDPNFATTVTNALAARAQRYVETLSSSATSYTVTHNLGSKDVIVQVYEVGDDFEQVWTTVKRPTANTVTLHFASAPSANQYRVVILGMA